MTENAQTPNPTKEPLTLYQWFSLAISFFGFVGVVIGLLTAAHTFNTNSYMQTYGWTIEIDKTFVQYSDIRPYFYDKKVLDAKSKIDTNRLYATAELILDNLDAVFNNQSYFKSSPGTESSWISAMNDYFDNSPVLREIYKRYPGYWPNVAAARNERCNN